MKNQQDVELIKITLELLDRTFCTVRVSKRYEEIWKAIEDLEFLDRLEDVQWHENEQISNTAIRLMDIHCRYCGRVGTSTQILNYCNYSIQNRRCAF